MNPDLDRSRDPAGVSDPGYINRLRTPATSVFHRILCPQPCKMRADMSEFPKKELETLWAPWRVEYFEKEPRDLNFLSAAAQASDDAAHLVIARRKNAFLMMNRYPYAVGHLMAVPYRKTAELSALGENEIVELWNLVAHAQTLLRTVTKAQGFNIGLNLGECAGAGVTDHLHIHIVPRWSGDTNFMPILTGTRVLGEGLRAFYDKLMEAQARIDVELRHKI
jgi:ATP adenylyltransferase